jgi:N-acetyl-gamma-glutamyl-phosphate reductase
MNEAAGSAWRFFCFEFTSDRSDGSDRSAMIKVGIVGASGYGGGELLRWLSRHPSARVASATSNTYAGQPVSASFPGLAGVVDLNFGADSGIQDVSTCDVLFLARDNGVAMGLAPELVAAGCKVIDLSADFRFRVSSDYYTWYGTEHKSPELAESAVYGLPELHREEIKSASVVGNPGCYTTTSILALAPLVAGRLIENSTVVIDGKSGVSGAGRSKFGLDYHFSETNESVSAYKIAGKHRHTGEIEQELSALAKEKIVVSFTPHLIPMTRGILCTCYATLAESVSVDDLRSRFREFYRNAPFVQVVDGLPASKHVLGTNMCHLGIAVDSRTNRVTVVSVTDNLGKGMAGQAIQNMNLMFGLEETTGLLAPGLWP